MRGARAASPCPLYHDAVELIGRRWTGAILAVLLETGPLRFRQIAQAVPDLSDRLLAERMRELEARGLVTRTELEVGVEYALTDMGRDLEPAVTEWLGKHPAIDMTTLNNMALREFITRPHVLEPVAIAMATDDEVMAVVQAVEEEHADAIEKLK